MHAKPDIENLPFSLKDLRTAIPKEYFRANLVKSLFYYFFDFTLITLLASAIYYSLHYGYYYLLLLLVPLQGSMFWSLFVVGHDCGHGSFAKNDRVNYVFGLFAHSFLLVPYFSWKKSHKKHHSYHSNLEKDESHVPLSKKYHRALLYILGKQTKRRVYHKLYQLCLYFPIYLFFNDHPNYKGKVISHFAFNDVFFRETEKAKFTISIIGYVAMLGLLAAGTVFFFPVMLFAYFLPWLVYNMLLHFVTYLHHTHEDNPWFYHTNWNYLKGALSTTDYDFGKITPVLNFFHHNIERYHVIHHLFPSIPHYNLKKANEAIVPILKDYYHLEAFTLATYKRIYDNCKYVSEPNTREQVHYFQA
ncbi:MAG: fatty acid desaturase [Spirochaetota bacterium]